MRVLFLIPPTDGSTDNTVRDFIYGCWCNGKRIGGMEMPPLNELIVATHLREQGMAVELLDATSEFHRFERLCRDRFAGIDAVVVMSSTQSFRNDIDVLTAIRKGNSTIVTILFGSHPTFMPEYCLKEEVVDHIILREPEESLAELLRAIADGGGADTVAGTGCRDATGRLRINPERPFMDMDRLPIPDRRLLPQGVDYFNPVVHNVPYTTLQTSRGCPGRCIFCTSPAFYGKKYRFRSADSVLEELRIIAALGYREVFIRDETFTALKKRNQTICEGMIRENIGLSWIANGRVDMAERDALELMKAAGCHMIKFGVETGSDRLLKNYHKGTTADQAVRAFETARKAGLDTHAHMIFGGPGESPGTIDESIAFVRRLNPTTASFGILTPYPGSRLFETVARRNPAIADGSESNLANLHVEGFYSEEICGLPGAVLSRAVVSAYRRFYLRPVYIARRLADIRSMTQFMVLVTAGLNILQFAISGNK